MVDEDVAGIVGRFIEGIEINEETLALGLIDEVGPIPCTYLTTSHTRTWWEKKQFIPETAGRTMNPDRWRKGIKREGLSIL